MFLVHTEGVFTESDSGGTEGSVCCLHGLLDVFERLQRLLRLLKTVQSVLKGAFRIVGVFCGSLRDYNCCLITCQRT